jgi:hypothetical protein
MKMAHGLEREKAEPQVRSLANEEIVMNEEMCRMPTAKTVFTPVKSAPALHRFGV